MQNDRWLELMNDSSLSLTDEEADQGWHFCYGWDGLLVGPGMKELEGCECHPEKDKAVKFVCNN
jgi:hypothetical protein